jgi:PmbA protein
MQDLAKQALYLCKFTDRDPFYTLPEINLQATHFAELDRYDSAVEILATETKIEIAKALEQELKARDSRISSEGGSASTYVSADVLANSQGFCASETSTLVACSVSGFAEDEVAEDDLNSGRKQSSGWSSRAHYFSDLDSVEAVAAEAAGRILRKLGARKPESGKYPVYFEPTAARSLWGNLLRAINGGLIYRDETYLAGRLETAVAAKGVSLLDDPFMKRGLASRNFDGEGVAASKGFLIEDGVLQTYLLGTYAANKLKMRSTGHAGGASNVIVTPGNLSEADMLKQVGTGLWVTQMMGQGVDIQTGDFSRGAQGLWIENGEVAYPVMEFTINSNLDRMFKDIVAIGNNVHKPSALITPGIVIGEMAISGV